MLDYRDVQVGGEELNKNNQTPDGKVLQVGGEELNRLQELIPIRCIQCGVTEGLKSQPAETTELDDDKRSRRVIINVCREHAKYRRWESKRSVLYTIKDNEQTGMLQEIGRKDLDKYTQLNNAIQTLDKKPCCMRENLKLMNLMTIYTHLSLFSQDDNIIKELLQKLLIQQYFQYEQLKREFKEVLDRRNTMQGLILNYKLNTFKQGFLQSYENILHTTQIFGSSSSTIKKKYGPSASAISFIKNMCEER